MMDTLKKQSATVSRKRVAFGLVLVMLAAVVFVAAAAEGGPGDLARQNAYLRQILHYFGKEPVDIYGSLNDIKTGKPAFTGAKMLTPVTVLDKVFYRVKEANGQITYVAPGAIAAIRPAPGIAPED